MYRLLVTMGLVLACLSLPLQFAAAATKADFVQQYVQQANKHTSRFVDQASL